MRKFLFFLLALHSLVLSAQNVKTQTSQSWSNSSWVNSTRFCISYKNDLTDINLCQKWNTNSLLWENDSRTSYSYISDTLVVSYLNENWNVDSLKFINSSRSDYDYSVEDNISITQSVWENNLFRANSRTTYHYNAEGLADTMLTMIKNVGESVWKNQSLWVCSYVNQNISVNYIKNWDEVNLIWKEVLKSSYIYTTEGKLDYYITYSWNGTDWITLSRSLYTYDGDGFMTNILSQNWDSSNLSWKNSSNIICTKGSNGLTAETIIQTFNSSSGLWENSNKTIYDYDLTNSVVLPQSAKFCAFPNPCVDKLYLEFPEAKTRFYLILDSKACPVLRGRNSSKNFSIDVSSLNKGVYVLKIDNDIYYNFIKR